jgi:hypothetical protein
MSIYVECIVKGSPPEFAGYGKVLEILGEGYYRVKTRSVKDLTKYVDSLESLNKTVHHKDPFSEVVVTNNNLAEILPVKLDDPSIIQSEWDQFSKYYEINHNRLYPKLTQLSGYFQNLLKEIIDVINFPYLDITLQIHDKKHLPKIIPLDVVHIDFYRHTNITIPIFLNPNERMNWHQNSSPDSIIQTSTYSLKHPSLVNVGLFHSVSLIPETTRVLVQLSYLHTIEQIYSKNPNIFNWYT